MALLPPFDFHSWIEENRHLLKPPVGAKKVFENAEFIIMVVGGPNARKEYHVNQGEEFFWMLEGDMILKVVDDGEFKEVRISEGEIFLLPGGVPHSPQRLEETVGLVIERPRFGDEKDGMRWYCENPDCRHVLHETFFKVENFLGQMNAAIEHVNEHEELRTCSSCSTVMEVPS
ncbi:MAG: 3-hydroxyanthranilate 3,4-dioxygenase [Bradymonadia bacterium]|jgi:3-hydroxyanthranilate 3,4-dioxygenase